MSQVKALYTVAELARKLGLSKKATRRLLREVGLLPREPGKAKYKVMIPLSRIRYALGEEWDSAMLANAIKGQHG